MQNNINTSDDWPKAPNALSRKLKPLLSNLREGLDINVTMTRSTVGGKKKGVHIIKVSKISSLPSQPSISSLDQFYEGNTDKNGQNGDDILGGDDIYRHSSQVSSPAAGKNRVQNPAGDDSDNSDDILGNNRIPSRSSD